MFFLGRKLLPYVLCFTVLLAQGCSSITIRYSNLVVDDWRSAQIGKIYGGKDIEGPVLRLEFTSDKDLVSIYSDEGKHVWSKLTDCNEKELSYWADVYSGTYPIGGVDQYGKNVPLPVRKDDADSKNSDVYHVYFDFYYRYKKNVLSKYDSDRHYNLRIDNFDVCLQIGAGSMVPFSGVKSNVLVIKNSKIKSVLGGHHY